MDCEKCCLTMVELDQDIEVVNAALRGCCEELWNGVKIQAKELTYTIYIGKYKSIDIFGKLELRMISQLKECFKGLDLHFYREVG